jgi:hypothetical protein
MGKLSKITKGMSMGGIDIQLPANNPSWLEVVLRGETNTEKTTIPLDDFWDVAGKISRETISPGAPLDASPTIINRHGINLILIDELKDVPFIDERQRNKAFSACMRAIKRMDVTPKSFKLSDEEFNEMQEE